MKVNKTNALAFLAISIMIFGGAYTVNWTSNSGNGYSIEYLPGTVDNALNIPEMIRDSKFEKVGPGLTEWLETGFRPSMLNSRGSQTSVLLFTAGDPTLNGLVTPVGYFSLGGSINYVQAYVNGVDHLRSVVEAPGLIRAVADFTSKTPAPKGNLDLGYQGVNLDLFGNAQSVQDVGQVPESFRTREILDVAKAQSLIGGADLNGTGVTINVHDTGVDVGHAALQGTLALKDDGSSAAFDGTGDWFHATNKFSEGWYDNVVKDAAMADVFSDALVPSAGSIALTGYGDLVLYSYTYGPGFTMADIWTGAAFGAKWADHNITSYNVTGLPGATSGYYFGISWTRTGNMHMMIPFVTVSTANNGVYDRVYHDWDTGLLFAMMVYGGLKPADFKAAVDYSFADEHLAGAWNDASKPYLAHDFLLADGKTAGSDGFPELSIGGLGNTYDVYDNDFDDNKYEMFSGIHSGGYGYAFISDYNTHGTGVAGSIAAQDKPYKMYSNDTDPDATLFSIQGVAPGAKILPSTGLLATSGDVWSYLWSTGFEPDSTGNWTQVDDHIANVSSNSWGFLSPVLWDDIFSGFDLYTLFMEVLGTPGLITGSPGIQFVISAGNDGNGYGTTGSPEPLSGILVGASTNSWWRANASASDLWANDSQGAYEIIGFSSAGPTITNYPKVDVVNVGAFDYSLAPTDPIYSSSYDANTGTNNSYQLFGGTSQAAPYTSASVAYIMQAYYLDTGNMLADNGMVKTYLKSGATDLGYDSYRQGAGHVNISMSVDIILDDALFNHVYNEGFPQAYKDRLDNALLHFFGENYMYGIANSMQSAYPAGNTDTALAFGSMVAGDSATLDVWTSINPSVASAWTYQEVYTATTAEFESSSYYTYHKLDTNFTIPGGADYVQFILSTNQAEYYAADAGSRLWIINAPDGDGDGKVDDTERELLTYGYNDYHQVLITVSTSQLGADTYLAVRDGAAEFGTNYTLTARAYDRVADGAVSINTVGGNNHEVTVNTAGLAPGYYTGIISFDTGGQAQYSYSVAYEANDYDTTKTFEAANGYDWTTTKDDHFDNSVMGAVSLAGNRESGDWRFYDIYMGGADSNARTLAVEVNWTNPGTVLDAYLLNYSGSVIADSGPRFVADGLWASAATGQGNANTKLLANVTGYTFAGEGGWFTLALHAVSMNTSLASPIETFTFGAAYLDTDVGAFEMSYTLERSGTHLVDTAGNPVTDDTAGITWSSATGGNPIPRFGPEGTQTSLSINSFVEKEASGTMTAPVPDGGAFTSLLFVEEVFVTEGMTVQGVLEWTHDGSDVDMILVAKGDAYSYGNGVCGAQASSASNPEMFSCSIDATGTYEIVATYYDGPGTDIDWELEFFGLASVVDTVDPDTSSIELSLVTAAVADSTYLLTSSTGGFNGGNDTLFTFTFDHVGPAVTAYATTPELLGAQTSIGEIYDAGEFDLTVMKGTETVIDNAHFAPGNHPIMIAASFMNYFGEDTTFTYTATDEFSRETTGTIVIYRDDTTVPEFNSIPADVEVKKNAEFSLSWDVADSSGGHFDIFVNGVEDESKHGEWMPGVLTVDFKFGSTGEYFIKLEVYDALDNGASDTVKVTVKSDSDDGFLPFNYVFAIVAIPILVALRRKFNK